MAHVAYITITGETQGAISGGCNTKDSMGNKSQTAHEDEISVLEMSHVMSKYSGQIGSEHSPISITKNIDKSSPLLANAFTKQEYVDCNINFYRTNEQGFNEKFYSIELKKALVSSIRFALPHTVIDNEQEMHEQIELSYKEIIWNHKISGTSGYNSGGVMDS